MRKQIVLLAKKMTACGLAAAMLFGVGPFDKVTTSKSAAADESYTYLYADLNWAEYWAAEDVYLKDGKNMTDSNETEDAVVNWIRGRLMRYPVRQRIMACIEEVSSATP